MKDRKSREEGFIEEPGSSKTTSSKLLDEKGNPKVLYIGTKYKGDTFDTSSYENSTFGGNNVLFFTDDKVNALGYGGVTDNVRAVNLEMSNPFIIDVEDSIRGDLKNTDNIKSEFNELWNKDYSEFEKKLKKMGDDKISDHIREINPKLQYFGYKLQKNDDGYYDLVSVRHGYGQGDVVSYSLETVNELFDYGEIDEALPREKDQWMTTDDVVKYVLMKNKQGSKYDGVIIENVIDSTNMAGGVGSDYIVFDSKQVKPVKGEIDWSKGETVVPATEGKTITSDEINKMSSSNTTFDNDAAEEYGIPSEHREILEEYNGKKYETINTDLREGIPNDSAESLSLAYETLPTFKGETFRGIYLPTWKYNQIYGGLREGDVFTEYGFTSTSLDRKRAEGFGGWYGDGYNDESQKSVIMIIKSKNGKYTLNSHEKEIGFNKGTRFRLLKKNENGSYVELYLEEI